MQKHDHSHEVRHTGATGTRHAHRPTTAICKKNGKGTRKYNKKHDHDTQVQLEQDTPNNCYLQKKVLEKVQEFVTMCKKTWPQHTGATKTRHVQQRTSNC